MNDYIKQLENQNEELKQKLAKYEQIADLRKFAGMHGKIGNSILAKVDYKVIDGGRKMTPINIGNKTYNIVAARSDVHVDVHLSYTCDDDGSQLIEFIKELSNMTYNP